MNASLDQARAAKAVLAEQLSALTAVNGIGVGREAEGHVVRVNLSEPADGVPDEVDGVPVRTRVVGPIVAR
jgi:hypothetical protein